MGSGFAEEWIENHFALSEYRYYVLDDDNNLTTVTMEELNADPVKYWGDDKRQIANDIVAIGDCQAGGYEMVRVSTVFLAGMMKFPNRETKQYLFETMLFAEDTNRYDKMCFRYETWSDARRGHDLVLGWVKRGASYEEIITALLVEGLY